MNAASTAASLPAPGLPALPAVRAAPHIPRRTAAAPPRSDREYESLWDDGREGEHYLRDRFGTWLWRVFPVVAEEDGEPPIPDDVRDQDAPYARVRGDLPPSISAISKKVGKACRERF